MDVILADMRLDQQPRRLPHPRQQPERPARAEGEIANPPDIDDRTVGAHLIDDARELGDHDACQTRIVPAWCAWQIATASASAASAEAIEQPGNSRRTISCTCDFSACPAPTTDFLTRFVEYSLTLSPRSAGASKHHAAGDAELQRRSRVLVDKALLDRRLVRPEPLDHLTDLPGTAPTASPRAADPPARAPPRRQHGERFPATSMIPHPVCRNPGSSPTTRIATTYPSSRIAGEGGSRSATGEGRAQRGVGERTAPRAALTTLRAPSPAMRARGTGSDAFGSPAQPGENILRHFEIGVDILHIVRCLRAFRAS